MFAISFDETIFLSAYGSFRDASSALNIKGPDIYTTSVSYVILGYKERLREIYKLMDVYKYRLENDSEQLKDVYITFVGKEKGIADTFEASTLAAVLSGK